MTQYSSYNIVYRLQKWMDSVPGQTFLNYAYSWGAAIVILGALFKLTHLPGANFWMFLGMGTEVVVFFLSAFDRPFDKTADGRELPTSLRYNDEETAEEAEVAEEVEEAALSTDNMHTGGTIIIGGGSSVALPTDGQTVALNENATQGAQVAAVGGWMGQQQETTPEMITAQSSYVEALNTLTETLNKVSEQSTRLTRDSEEMENLNRTLTGICKVYEMQLKSASQQIGTIDQINDQTRRMAEQIEQLNKIYARMISAMTVNLKGTAASALNTSEE